jgi:ADP-heptose:LPS heptosyltransferase
LKRSFVYLIRKKSLGDVLWIEPVIRQFAAHHKKVIVFTKHPELFENYPLPNVHFVKDLSKLEKVLWGLENWFPLTRFFVSLDGAYEKNPKTHVLYAYQQKAGLPITHEYPRLYLSQEEKRFRPSEVGERKYVVLHLESLAERNYRKVYGVEWEKVVSALSAKGFVVIQVGKDPLSISGTLHVKTSLREAIGIISGAAFFIGIDSGPSHLAAALGVPSIIFFGAVNPDFRHFRDLFKGRFLQQFCEYAGCYHESVETKKPFCRLVGNEGIPKCSLHTTEYVLDNIEKLIRDYQLA